MEREQLIKALNAHYCPVCRDCHLLEAVDAYILTDRRRCLEEAGNVLQKAQNYYVSVPDAEDRWKVSAVLGESIDSAIETITRLKG